MSIRPAICALSFVLACSSKGNPPSRGVDSGRTVQPDANGPTSAKLDAAVDAVAAAQAEIIVGSNRGLEAWQPDGSGKRVISRGTALHPRWLDATNVVVIATREFNLAKGARLERISIGDGQRSKLAKIPPFSCRQPSDGNVENTAPQDLVLALQDPSDFEVDEGGQKACISLMDRNINMMDYAVDVLVDLKAGRVQRWLTAGEESCIPPMGVPLSQMSANLKCKSRSTPPSVGPKSFSYSFTEQGTLLRERPDGGEPVLKIPGYRPAPNAVSPSGRWLILSGDQEDANYIHQGIVLLDREKGEVYPIHVGRSWPAPLRPKGTQKPPHIKTPIADAAPVVGETDIRWLGTSADTELLIIGDLVVKPGAFSFVVKGEVAR